MQKIFIFLAICLFVTSDGLDVQNRSIGIKEEDKNTTSEVILEFISDGVYNLKVKLKDSIQEFRLVKEKKDIEVLIAEDEEVINRIEHEVRKMVAFHQAILCLIFSEWL